jgi:hypothetical protein
LGVDDSRHFPEPIEQGGGERFIPGGDPAAEHVAAAVGERADERDGLVF